MADEQFYTILTNIGKAKIANATLLNSNVTLTTLKVGDGNGDYYNPTEDQTELKNVVHTCQVGSIYIDKKNTNWVVVETIIPGSVGGFTIREIGLFDTEGDLIAVGKYPETYKPIVANGASKDLNVKTIFEVSNSENVTLNINPSVIIATKEDINNIQEQIDENTAQLNDLANPNLLINEDFSVWQRGTHFENVLSGQYQADRWQVVSNNGSYPAIVDAVADGLKITQDNNAGCVLRYYFEESDYKKLKDKTLTCSISRDGVISTFSPTIYVSDSRYYLEIGIGNNLTVNWVKLELGSVATPFIPRPYGEELALCRRYGIGFKNERPRFRTNAVNGNQLIFFIPLTTMLRIAPTTTDCFTINSLNGSEIEGFTFTVANCPNGIIVNANKSSHGMSDGQLMIKDNAFIDSEIY